MQSQNNSITNGIIWKQLLLFSAPLLVGNLFQQLYNTVDSIIVGNYVGRNALAAVGSSTVIINMIIGFFGVKPQTWLLDEKLIKLTLSLPGLLGGGLNLLVYLIAIEGVSPELYEAASLDGATRFNSLIFITLPQIAYMISIQLLLSISGSLLAFDTPYIMTDGSGGPNGAATTVVFGIYNKAYTELQYGQAMATSIVLLIIMLTMNFIKQAFEKKFSDD